MELKAKHLSYSSISLFSRCPREWWLRYQYGISSPPTPALSFGTAMHKTIQGALLLNGDILTAGRKFETNLVQACLKDSIRLGTNDKANLLKLGQDLLNEPIIQQMIGEIKVSGPEQVEKKVEFLVPGVDLPVIGYIDIIDNNGHPYDIKTSAWDWDEARADAEIQPDFYLTALDLEGDHRHAGDFSHLILVKKPDNPTAYMMDTHRVGYQERVFALVQKTWDGIQSEAWESKVVRSACANCKLKGPCYYHD